MNARGVVVVLALSVFICSTPRLLAADGWLPGFSAGQSSSSGTAKKSSTTSWWPWSSSSTKPKSKPKRQASTFNKMTKSTKSAWNKTVDFLNPFDNPPAAKSKSRDDQRTGGWFSSPEPDNKPTSVHEWIGGERPTF